MIFKLQLLSCGFYLGLNVLLAGAVLVVIHRSGLGIFFGGKYPFWSVGLKFAVFFGVLWAISFFSAWCLVYFPFRARMTAFHG